MFDKAFFRRALMETDSPENLKGLQHKTNDCLKISKLNYCQINACFNGHKINVSVYDLVFERIVSLYSHIWTLKFVKLMQYVCKYLYRGHWGQISSEISKNGSVAEFSIHICSKQKSHYLGGRYKGWCKKTLKKLNTSK